MSFIAGHIKITDSTDSHNSVPTVILLKDFQHFFLLDNFFQFTWIFTARDTQKQAVIIFGNIKQMDVSGTGDQAAIVIIYRIAQTIITGIQLAGSFQQFYLIHHSPLQKQVNHIIRMCFSAQERKIGFNNFMHFLLDTLYIIQFNGTADMQITEISFRNRIFKRNRTVRIQFFDCTHQNKTQRTDIGTHT